MPKLKKFDVVEILWQDTNIPTDPGWMSEQEHSDWKCSVGSLVCTVGIYIGHDKNFINLVGDCEADTRRDMNFLRPINVGRGFIQEIHVLTRKLPIAGQEK